MKRLSAFVLLAMLCTSGVASAEPAAEGGAMQVGAQPGCLNQWMFNGTWRVRVTNVAFHPASAGNPDADAWAVAMQWANGTSNAGVSPVDTNAQDIVLGLQNGDTITTTDSSTGNLSQQQLFFHTFPAAGQFSYTQVFLAPNLDQNNKPVKLLVTFDVPKYNKNHPGSSGKFWRTRSPGGYNYRIDLTCSK
jgi:hypothetical protein